MSTNSNTSTEPCKPKKRIRACKPCQRLHVSCDTARPCHRCKEKGKSELCLDVSTSFIDQTSKRARTETTSLPNILTPNVPFQIVPSPQMISNTPTFAFAEFDSSAIDLLYAPISQLNQFIISEDDKGADFSSSRLFFLNHIYEYAQKNIPDILEDVKKLIDDYRPRMEEFRKSLTKEIISDMSKQFEQEILQANLIYDKIDIPTALFQISSLHYCNDAFKKLTGYNGTIPSSQYLILEMMSPLSWKKNFYYEHGIFMDGCTNFFILPVQWLCYGKYIEVIMTCSIRRNILGIPMCCIIHIVPVVTSAVLDTQISNIARRIEVNDKI